MWCVIRGVSSLWLSAFRDSDPMLVASVHESNLRLFWFRCHFNLAFVCGERHRGV
jgi:hypothetical protein